MPIDGVDLAQSTVDTLYDAAANPLCYGVLGPLASWLWNCPQVNNADSKYSYIPPAAVVGVTPAAPNTIADMTSGLWNLDELWRQQKIRNANAMLVQQTTLMGNGAGTYYEQGSAQRDKEKLTVPEWMLIGGMAIMGLVAVRAIIR